MVIISKQYEVIWNSFLLFICFFAQYLEKRNKFSLSNFASYHILSSCKDSRVSYKRSLKNYDSFLEISIAPLIPKNSTGNVLTLMLPASSNSCYFYNKQILKKGNIQLLRYHKMVKIWVRILLVCICN